MQKQKEESRGKIIKKRGVRGSVLNKAVLKVKEAKKIMKNVVTVERNKLFKSKFGVARVS